MSNELTVQNQMSLADLGQILTKSGFFQDTKDAAQAVVKVLAGQELGFGPIASMTGIYVIQGRITMSANLLAAAIKRTQRYNYRVVELTDAKADIAFFENGKECGRSVFTDQDARKAGTKNMDKFPRNMLFARALSNGARWYCADVFGGPVYTPEELGANINEDGEVIDIPAQPVKPEPKPASVSIEDQLKALPELPLFDAEEMTNSEGKKYADIETETLGYMRKSILEALRKNHLEEAQKQTYLKKLQAIEVITKDRENAGK